MQKIPNCRQSICLCRAELHFLQFVDLAKAMSNDDQVTLSCQEQEILKRKIILIFAAPPSNTKALQP